MFGPIDRDFAVEFLSDLSTFLQRLKNFAFDNLLDFPSARLLKFEMVAFHDSRLPIFLYGKCEHHAIATDT